MEPGERPPAPPPNNAPPTRPHMWGATPCIEARAYHKVRPTQRLSGQPKDKAACRCDFDLDQSQMIWLKARRIAANIAKPPELLRGRRCSDCGLVLQLERVPCLPQ